MVSVFDCCRLLEDDSETSSDSLQKSFDSNLVCIFGCAPSKTIGKKPALVDSLFQQMYDVSDQSGLIKIPECFAYFNGSDGKAEKLLNVRDRLHL